MTQKKSKSKPITAAGGVVYKFINDKLHVLLIFRNDFWDIPKGKLEKGESIPMCAAREVSEEVGSSLPLIVNDLGTTQHSYAQKDVNYDKTTYWYSMIFSRSEKLIPQKEEGIELIEWVELDEAIERVGFENLIDILQRFKADFIA